MRIRSGIILIQNHKLALIERQRGDRHYFSFPGGGVDEGETAEQAAVREAQEELGIIVLIKQKIAEVIHNGNSQYYFLAEQVGGEFGTGTGEEYGEYDPVHGTYLPMWMPLDDVLQKNVLPRELAELVIRCMHESWPQFPVKIFEE